MAAGVSGAIALVKQKTDTLAGVVAALALVLAIALSQPFIRKCDRFI